MSSEQALREIREADRNAANTLPAASRKLLLITVLYFVARISDTLPSLF
ncbi:MAG: hypothetical protein U1E10_03375 [Bdellovibrionales bacterium]|jgi:hypothetical protein|nr:hypothetical protein [Bdellovibrionales bacterium]